MRLLPGTTSSRQPGTTVIDPPDQEVDIRTKAEIEADLGAAVDRIKVRSWDAIDLAEGVGAGLSSFCLVWLIYEQLTPLSGTLGFFLSWWVVFLIMYRVLVRQRHGPMAARDRF